MWSKKHSILPFEKKHWIGAGTVSRQTGAPKHLVSRMFRRHGGEKYVDDRQIVMQYLPPEKVEEVMKAIAGRKPKKPYAAVPRGQMSLPQIVKAIYGKPYNKVPKNELNNLSSIIRLPQWNAQAFLTAKGVPALHLPNEIALKFIEERKFALHGIPLMALAGEFGKYKGVVRQIYGAYGRVIGKARYFSRETAEKIRAMEFMKDFFGIKAQEAIKKLGYGTSVYRFFSDPENNYRNFRKWLEKGFVFRAGQELLFNPMLFLPENKALLLELGNEIKTHRNAAARQRWKTGRSSTATRRPEISETQTKASFQKIMGINEFVNAVIQNELRRVNQRELKMIRLGDRKRKKEEFGQRAKIFALISMHYRLKKQKTPEEFEEMAARAKIASKKEAKKTIQELKDLGAIEVKGTTIPAAHIRAAS